MDMYSPTVSVAAVGSGTLELPEDLAGGFGVVTIYRRDWCPFCNDYSSSLHYKLRARSSSSLA